MSLFKNLQQQQKTFAADKILCSMPNTPISLLLFFNNKIILNRVSLHFQQINIPESTSKVMLLNTGKVMLKVLQARL